ncbi:MAG: sterol desaturase family protein [Verrucomicrobiae bacterium]|nr:sterol desaturase family protein [Verrucomicrobiae bacterium]
MLPLILSLLLGIIASSFFEWILHRFVMHKPVGPFRYAFEAHAIIHHQVFSSDHTYHLMRDEDKKTIPMAWWNGPVLILCNSVPFLLFAVFTGYWTVWLGGLIAGCLYYGTYEYIHWCMHLPKGRRIEQPWVYRRLNAHHLLHHRYMHKNFNVVLPLADFCLGTLVLRSKIPFPQPVGPAVPNVQPRKKAA